MVAQVRVPPLTDDQKTQLRSSFKKLMEENPDRWPTLRAVQGRLAKGQNPFPYRISGADVFLALALTVGAAGIAGGFFELWVLFRLLAGACR